MVDVNKPVENPELVAAIEALQQNRNAETETAFFAQLKKSNFLFVLQNKLAHDAPDEDGKITLNMGTTISIHTLVGDDGQTLLFGFTDWPSLYKWREQPDQQTLIVPFEQLSGMVLRDGIDYAGFIVNPATHNFFIPKQAIAHADGRYGFYTIQKETKVKVGEPRDYPHELVNALKQRLKPMKEVKRAWLMLMVKDNEQSYLIILEHTGDVSTISPAVGAAASPYLKSGMFVDIVTYDQAFGKDITEGKKPFYKRGLFK